MGEISGNEYSLHVTKDITNTSECMELKSIYSDKNITWNLHGSSSKGIFKIDFGMGKSKAMNEGLQVTKDIINTSECMELNWPK